MTQNNWLSFPDPFTQPASRAGVPGTLTRLLSGEGNAEAREATEIRIWHDARALYLRARCATAGMERVRDLAARKPAYGRDDWGQDALEVQIDPGLTRAEYLHFILPPTGVPVTYRGFNNRQEQGWHPAFDFTITLEEDAWIVEAAFPFEILGPAPAAGDAWGLNILRVNPDEPGGYVQWAPTFGDALRPELFGVIRFGEEMANREAEIAAYRKRYDERLAYFRTYINEINDQDVLDELGMADWAAWDRYLAAREHPIGLRWDGVEPGADGIPEIDRPIALEMANTLVEEIAGWQTGQREAFSLERLEPLGDAWLLTGDRRYVKAFERAVEIHGPLLRDILATAETPHHRVGGMHPYHDYQVIRAAVIGYVYLTMRTAGLSPRTHAVMMWTMLRAARFAAYEISIAYNYGNHQVYESSGLAMVAAIFPEFPESAYWADVAGRAIRYHLDREVYPDGGYLERCGYHSVALGFLMQAVAIIRANGADGRFAALMHPGTLAHIERMHEWNHEVMAPDGAIPAFGDFGAHTQRRYLVRAAAIFHRPDLTTPATQSVSLPSHFTIMRDADHYMAVDHGPLGGQHSHVDTMGFVAYAYSRPVALDPGIGTTYDDSRYVSWFRTIRAHNVVAIGDVEPEKVAECTHWHAGEHADILAMRSRAYEHAFGVLHDRTIYFVKGLGWLIRDRLTGTTGQTLDWLLQTPVALTAEAPGVLHGDGLLVLSSITTPPVLDQAPASVPVPETADWRFWDAVKRLGAISTRNITSLTLQQQAAGDITEFAAILLPYQGERPQARLEQIDGGWALAVHDRCYTFRDHTVTCADGGRQLWQEG